MALPVVPTIGGKGSNKLKSDMQGIGGSKPKKGKMVGSLKKNPGKGARKKA